MIAPSPQAPFGCEQCFTLEKLGQLLATARP